MITSKCRFSPTPFTWIPTGRTRTRNTVDNKNEFLKSLTYNGGQAVNNDIRRLRHDGKMARQQDGARLVWNVVCADDVTITSTLVHVTARWLQRALIAPLVREARSIPLQEFVLQFGCFQLKCNQT